jgi:cardiolipin synthase
MSSSCTKPFSLLPQKLLLASPPGYAGNCVRLLVDGEAAYPAMLEGIAQARHSIALESYILAADATGSRFVAALTAAARRGVAVRVLIDGIGSLGTPAAFFSSLTAAGGEVAVFSPPFAWPPSLLLWQRDHRKLLVIDQAQAFIGGLNIGDAYAPQAWGGAAWHDTHALLHGPVAHGLARLFARTWLRQTQKVWQLPIPPPLRSPGQTFVRLLESRLTQRYSIRRAYLQAIVQAQQRICICNAYCIPDRGILRALRNACGRGVQVQLLLAGTTDVRAVQHASRALYREMLAWGVQIWEWQGPVLHAKSAVIDGTWCSLGSYNMDRRSLLHNLEANIACEDAALGTQMVTQFTADLQHSHRVEHAHWHRRPLLQKFLEKFWYKLRYLL